MKSMSRTIFQKVAHELQLEASGFSSRLQLRPIVGSETSDAEGKRTPGNDA